MAQTLLTPDLCVLGGGTAAAETAVQAALLGLRTVLVCGMAERRPPPARELHALAAAAGARADARHAAAFGFEVSDIPVNFFRLRQQIERVLADLSRNDATARFAALGVGVIEADGSFVDPLTVAAGAQEIRARRFLLVPDMEPEIPAIDGLPKTPHLTAAHPLDLREIPQHLVVIGAGASGLSLAQSFRRLGAGVTVFDAGMPLAGEDRECAGLLLDALAGEGIRVAGGVDVRRVEGKRGALRVVVREGERERSVEASHLLIACGWRLLLDSYALDLAGIDVAKLAAGGDPRTANGRVFVAHHVPSAPQTGSWHARLLLTNFLLRTPLRADPARVARATATDPSLAHVGLTEAEARERHPGLRVLRWPFAENEAAVLARKTGGIAKLVTTHSGRLLGATLVGAGAAEMIAPLAATISSRGNLRGLAGPLFPKQSRAAIAQQAAQPGLAAGLTRPAMQRIIAMMRWFG